MPETGFPRLPETAYRVSRRDFLGSALVVGALLPQRFDPAQRRGRGRGRRTRSVDPSQIPAYSYRTLPVSRFPALQDEYDSVRSDRQLSRNKVFRDEVDALGFKLPGGFPGARSVVVVAAFAKTMYANFHLDGQVYRIMVPFQYYEDDLNAESLRAIIEKEVIGEPGHRVVDITEQVPLKLLAARSALGRYGRNNLIFVDGMGSYNLLYAFLTDYAFPGDDWSAVDILDECRRCHRCDSICPTSCIDRRSFPIDVDHCITLYNENPGPFPNWIHPGMHHALMGCMRCQTPCPANFEEVTAELGDISDAETRKILAGTPDETLLAALQRKLRGFPADGSKDVFPVLTRNLSVLIRS